MATNAIAESARRELSRAGERHVNEVLYELGTRSRTALGRMRR